jgi:hypothetical protein
MMYPRTILGEYLYYRIENKAEYFHSEQPYKGWKFVILMSLLCLLPCVIIGILLFILYLCGVV